MALTGKLILSSAAGQRQEFELGKPTMMIGRGAHNDIVLADPKASRQHAEIKNGPDGFMLIDLGSANGTRLNGVGASRAALKPGDVIAIGACELAYEAAAEPAENLDVTIIDNDAQLERTIADASLAMAMNDTSVPRLAIHTAGRTWEIELTRDTVTIGRSADNDICIEAPQMTRRHARIERQSGGFLLRDVGSTNGTWLGVQRIEERMLEDGDAFRIGPATFLFKAAFENEDLTIVGESRAPHALLRPVVFVPGFMGSELWRGGERFWPNIPRLLREPQKYRSDVPMEARGIVGEVVIVPNLITQEKYDRLGDYLVESLGYERGKNLLEAPYDWRQDNRESAKTLARLVDDWQARVPDACGPITLIGHSMGCLVSRYYVERLGGNRKVGNLMLMGGPHAGVPKIAMAILTGRGMLPFGLLGDKLRDVVSSFSSSYQLLPTTDCVRDGSGKPVLVYEDENWLDGRDAAMLRTARAFRTELGSSMSVPTVSIFGYGIKTHTRLLVQRDARGAWIDVRFSTEDLGDDTIPEWSGVLPGSQVHPVRQRHGALYADNDVKMRLKFELGKIAA